MCIYVSFHKVGVQRIPNAAGAGCKKASRNAWHDRGLFRSAQVRAYVERASCWNIGNPYMKSLCPVGVCPYLCSSELWGGWALRGWDFGPPEDPQTVCSLFARSLQFSRVSRVAQIHPQRLALCRVVNVIGPCFVLPARRGVNLITCSRIEGWRTWPITRLCRRANCKSMSSEATPKAISPWTAIPRIRIGNLQPQHAKHETYRT